MKSIIDNKLIFFSLSFLIYLLLYYPTFNGGPIWDDWHFLFSNEYITGKDFNLSILISHSNWAISVLAQKIMYTLFEENYFNYHVVNFFLHFFNSLLFYQFLTLQKIKIPHWAYLIFLLHPSMIISVAWIIQFKTLLCAFFVLISLNLILLSAINEKKEKRLQGLSFLSFLFSLSSKSASIPLLPAIFFFHRKFKLRLGFFISAFILVLYAGVRLIFSPVTQDGIEKAVSTSSLSSTFEFIFTSFPQTINWYFWQALLPIDTIPIRGGLSPSYLETAIGLFTMLIFFLLIRKNKRAMHFFLASFFMVLPFTGIIPAPYMTSAWVSDQHLYLVLIFFIPAVSLLMEKISQQKVELYSRLLSLMLIGYVSFTNINNFKDEASFFKSSFNYNNNIPAAYHLLNHYIKNGELEEAKTHYFHLITSIPIEERRVINLFWAQILQFEPLLFEQKSE